MDALYLGIDFGTSGCRASIIDNNKDLIAEHVISIPPTTSQKPGHHEQDPESWWAALQSLLEQAIPEGRINDIKAICIDGTSSTLLLCDKDGNPVSPALMYNDSRSREQAIDIGQYAPIDSPARGPGSSLAKLLYLDQQFPQACYALHQADWLSSKLTGIFGHSDENNCLKLGYDSNQQCWPDWIRSLDFNPDMLPVIHEPGQHLSTIDAEIAKQFGFSPDTLVIAGTTDSTAAFLACGANQTGEAMTCLGSTLVTKILSPVPVFSSRHGVYSHKILGRWLVGGASNSGGASLLKFFSIKEMESLSPLIKPEQKTGLDYYPLPGIGERFPVADPEYPPRMPESLPATNTQRAVIFQGLLEGISKIEKQAYDLLQQLGTPYPRQVFSTGGGSNNRAWNVIRQLTLDVPVFQSRHYQASYGVALLARNGHHQ
ncbi:MAG: FGGY-family carbohydrate kinase [Gammaproteobacteria bacterium]|nr:FGGY-family carbohydrate kinase [Gammaproteobacteria bacterium]